MSAVSEVALLTALFEVLRYRAAGPDVVVSTKVGERTFAVRIPAAEISEARVRTALLDALECPDCEDPDSRVYTAEQIAAFGEEFTGLAAYPPALPDRQAFPRAARLATRLMQRGAGAGKIVGVEMSRSPDLATAILAIWKTGAAYLPIDPTYPEARKSFLLADSGAAFTVTDADFEGLDAEEPFEGLPIPLDSLAYVIYTSGSSGEPKSVPITHRSFTNFLDSVRHRVGITASDRFVAATTVAFDISLMELMLPLAAGATLVVADSVTSDVLRGATMTFGTPAAWRMLLDSGWEGDPGLTALCGGESLSRELADRILARTKTLWNMYGPTETTIASTMGRVERDGSPITIGRALARTQLYIEDGELWIGGAGVSPGYCVDGLFRTGDLVRLAPDGNLEFLGRADRQLKVRGFRIEPVEIEAALLRCGAAEAVVQADGDALIAYVTPALPTAELREKLAAILPAHMVPGKLVAVSAFPVTANGKVDRRALKTLRSEEPAAPFEPPNGLVEKALAEIFREVLHTPRVSATDSFFHLGGHSLLAAQVLSRVWEVWRVSIPTRVLFESPSLRELALRIQALQGQRIPELPAKRDAHPPLSPAQERLWFLNEFHQEERALYNIPAVIRLTGPLDPDRLTLALNALIARHEPLRSSFRNVEGAPVQTIVSKAQLSIQILSSAEARALAARPFDLSQAPLLRAALVRLGPDDWEFLLTMHHIVSDGWSMGVVFRELSALYRGEVLPQLAIQYSDIRLEASDSDLDYWRQPLQGLGAPVELPSDRPRGAALTYRGARKYFEWPAELGSRLIAFSRANNATPFMTLLAAFEVLLYRYTGESDLVIGTPVANRSRVETEPLIGFFVNTLPLRTDVSGDASFAEILERTRSTALDGYSHGELPFQKLVEALQPERSLAHTPFFQVMFALQNASANVLDLPGITASETRYELEWVKVDLSVNVESIEPSFTASIDYNRDLFDAARIDRMGGHLVTILEAALENPGCAIARLPMLTAAERHTLERDWNDTYASYPDADFATIFHELAKRRPDAVAVEFEGNALTYAELDRASDAVAGVPEGRLVPVLVERDAGLIPKMLAIWKRRSAYVPIDPEYPAERQKFMREDIGETAEANGLAYVIYTSGSTGKPKGVRIHQRSLINLLEAMRTAVPVDEQDVMIALATAAFDMSIPELWLPLYCGAKLVLGSRDDARDPTRVRALLETTGATVMQGTPNLWAALLDEGWIPAPGFKLLVGAEALPQIIADRLAKLPCTVWNMFGPTETTVWSTMGRVTPGPVTIGRPIANTRVFVLDPNGEMVPVGNPGELYIAGDGVAEGYWNRPELTAQRFVTLVDGERAYRTGDRVRYREDGQLEFLERLDTQVKLRGYRIELDEVEGVLAQHPAVTQAAAAIRGDSLFAWYTGQAVPDEELRQHVARLLPAYMVPSRFFLVTAFPMNAHGKLNRAALVATERIAVEQEAITDPMEETLLPIWREVLRNQSFTTRDSFFEFGGHSLSAMRLVMRIEKATGQHLPVQMLFSTPTIREVVRYLRRNAPVDLPAGFTAIQGEGSKPPIFFFNARALCWNVAAAMGRDQPMLGVDPESGWLEGIRAISPDGPYRLAAFGDAAGEAFEAARQLGKSVRAVAMIDGDIPESTGFWKRLTRNTEVPRADVRVIYFRSPGGRDPRAGWNQYLLNPMELIDLPGPAFESEAVELIAQCLKSV